jgi:hypothetical protein
MNVEHELLGRFLGGNIVAPVREFLTQRPPQRQFKVLDLCTGTGKWYVIPYIVAFPVGSIPGVALAGYSKWQKNSLILNSMPLI